MTIHETSSPYCIDTWEAWIEIQEATECPYTLYVVGEIYWNEPRIRPALAKRISKDDPPNELHLELRPGILDEEGEIEELLYAECLKSSTQYKALFIHVQDSILLHLNGIECTTI